MSPTINLTWAHLLKTLLDGGREVSPRGFTTKELIGFSTEVYMGKPLLTVTNRKLGYKFAAAEAAWIASGDNRVETIKPYSKQIANFSDDGYMFFGAYGPKFIDQVSYVAKTLATDRDSRQAVINIWREQPNTTKDVPCTLSLQWMIREDVIRCVATMRSSDAWLGWPYDVHNFSELSAYVALLLKQHHGVSVQLGSLILNAGSQHLYKRDWEEARRCIFDFSGVDYAPLDLAQFDGPQDLVAHLWNCANGDCGWRSPWLKEVYNAP